jgi:DNA primase (bacterial type)
MTLRDLADAVKQSVTAAQVAESIGVHPDSKGFCRCPLHGEKTGSMKVYPGNRGWYCFGCHQGGSVIDLVMLYYGDDLRGAVRRLNDEFALGLPVDGDATREQQEAARRRAEEREREKKRREAFERKQKEAFERYCDLSREIANLEMDLKDFAPKTPDASWAGRFQEALNRLPQLKEEAEYLATVCIAKEDTWTNCRVSQRGSTGR